MSEIEENLWLGDHETAERIVGEDWSLVTCAQESSLQGENVFRLDLFDGRQKDSREKLLQGAERIHSELEKGRKVFVHCMAGVSRSPSVVICYLLIYRQMSFSSAYCMVREKRPLVSLHRHFEAVLKALSSQRV